MSRDIPLDNKGLMTNTLASIRQKINNSNHETVSTLIYLQMGAIITPLMEVNSQSTIYGIVNSTRKVKLSARRDVDR